MIEPVVAAVIATYRRPAELRRCLTALAAAGPELRLVVVADNGDDPETAAVVASFAPLAERLAMPANLGAGGGLRAAMKRAVAVQGPRLTHYLILDDDTELPAGSLTVLREAMGAARADLASPLIEDGSGRLGWFPGLNESAAWSAVKAARTPEEYLARAGGEPVAFSWSTFVCLLATAAAIHTVGWPRDDFWVRGEDLEYSLRLTNLYRGVFVPAVRVRHLPPALAGADSAARAERWKILAMLQNSAFLCSRVSHGRRLAWHLPGNVARFLASPAGGVGALGPAIRALWNGLIRGRPAGVAGFDGFKRRAGQ